MAEETNRLDEPFELDVTDGPVSGSAAGSAADGADQDTRAIRDDIESTRAQMSETIDAIQDRLSISNISEQVKEEVTEHVTHIVQTAKRTLYDLTINKAGDVMKNIGTELRNLDLSAMKGRNVLPFVLIGTGVGLMIYNGRGSGASRSGRTRTNGGARQLTEGAGDQTGGSAGLASKLTSTTAYRKLSDGTSAIGDRLSSVGSAGREQYEHFMEVNPLAVGAAALAVGAAVGFAIPRTQYEGEMLGGASTRLMSKVEDSARDAFTRAQSAAQDAARSIGESVAEQSGANGGQTGT
jgi:hypothetical protein